VGKADDRARAKAKAQANAEARRIVALRVLQGCDEVAARELAVLAAAGVTPSCTSGCTHCCHLEIPVSRPEAEVLVGWLIAHRGAAELDAIRDRLRAWLAWYRDELPALAAAADRADAFFRHGPACALLVDRVCTAYEVRPVTCRNHLVSSPVAQCDPATSTGEPDLLLGIARATYDHVVELRRTIERQGGSYEASVHLLPEWLAHLLDVEAEPWSRRSIKPSAR
jgi:hypothetical protein